MSMARSNQVRSGKKRVLVDAPALDFSYSRTKQSFKDSTDINKIVKNAQRAGAMDHIAQYPPHEAYGEFTGVDLLGAYQQCERAQAIFADLPVEIRNEFENDAFRFAGFASDPANIDRLQELLPAIAEPGEYRFPRPGDEPIAVRVVPEVPVTAEVPAEEPTAPPTADSPAEPDASTST